ncbi:MAG: hypothetical protein ACREMY_33315, partial [bacterium]
PATLADLRAEHDLQLKFYDAAKESWQANADINALRETIAEYTNGRAPSDVASAATALDDKLAALAGTTERRNRGGGRNGGAVPTDFVAINRAVTSQITALDNGDLAPTEFMDRAYSADCSDLSKAITSVNSIESSDLPAFNALLAKNNLKPVARPSRSLANPVCR